MNLNVALTFSEPVRHGSFVLKDSASNVVSSGVSYNPQAQTITLTPGAELLGSRHYTATVSGARDVAESVITASRPMRFASGLTVPTAFEFLPGWTNARNGVRREGLVGSA